MQFECIYESKSTLEYKGGLNMTGGAIVLIVGIVCVTTYECFELWIESRKRE